MTRDPLRRTSTASSTARATPSLSAQALKVPAARGRRGGRGSVEGWQQARAGQAALQVASFKSRGASKAPAGPHAPKPTSGTLFFVRSRLQRKWRGKGKDAAGVSGLLGGRWQRKGDGQCRRRRRRTATDVLPPPSLLPFGAPNAAHGGRGKGKEMAARWRRKQSGRQPRRTAHPHPRQNGAQGKDVQLGVFLSGACHVCGIGEEAKLRLRRFCCAVLWLGCAAGRGAEGAEGGN